MRYLSFVYYTLLSTSHDALSPIIVINRSRILRSGVLILQFQSTHVVAVAVAVAVAIVVVVDYRLPLCMWLTELLSLLVFNLSVLLYLIQIMEDERGRGEELKASAANLALAKEEPEPPTGFLPDPSKIMQNNAR